jgi:hypothetical protein
VNSHIAIAKQGKPEHHQPAQIDAIDQQAVDRHCQELEQAGGQQRRADLPSIEAANAAEEQRRQIDRAEYADAGDK